RLPRARCQKAAFSDMRGWHNERRLSMAAPTVMNHPATAPDVAVRAIGAEDLRASLRDGLRDFGAHRGDLLFVGLLYPAIGFIAGAAALGNGLIPYFFPSAAGVALLGPVAAL